VILELIEHLPVARNPGMLRPSPTSVAEFSTITGVEVVAEARLQLSRRANGCFGSMLLKKSLVIIGES
jgi:hypothetical protein